MRSFIGILLAFLFMLNVSLSMGQENLLESCREELSRLEQEMNIRYEEYFKKYQFEGVSLKAVTLYEYNEKNELITERSSKPTDRFYYIDQYEKGRKVRSLGNYLNHEKLEFKKYDEFGRVTERIEYSDGSSETERFRYKTIDDSKKIQIVETYRNDRLQWRSVIKNPFGPISESLLYRRDDTSIYFKNIVYLSADKKRLERSETYNYENDYTEIRNYVYADTLLVKQTTYKPGKDTTEYRYVYSKKGQKIKEEEFKNGQLQFTTFHEYDTKDHNTTTKGYWGSGNICYVCLYEYDVRGNKISYLYFYCY